MVFVFNRAEEEGCLQLEFRNVSSVGLCSCEAYSQVTPETCTHVCNITLTKVSKGEYFGEQRLISCYFMQSTKGY